MLDLVCIPKIMAVAGALCSLSTAKDGFEIAKDAIEACAKGGEAALAFKEADPKIVRHALDRCQKRLQSGYAKALDSEARDDDHYRQTIDTVFVSVGEVFDRCVPKAEAIAALGLDPEKIARSIADAAANEKYEEFAENGAGRRILIDLVTTAYGELRNNKRFMEAMQGANWAEAFKRFERAEEAAERRHRRLDATTLQIETKTNKVDGTTQRIEAKIDQLLQIRVRSKGADVGLVMEKGVAEALAMVERGAAEGDERCKMAFDLFNSGRGSESELVFRALAEEKEAASKKAAKDAAFAFRNLGAIVGLRDPKRALHAYRMALEFDRDDWESMLCIGSIQQEHGTLSEAATQFRQVLSLDQTDNKS
jgi:hypothetical protein